MYAFGDHPAAGFKRQHTVAGHIYLSRTYGVFFFFLTASHLCKHVSFV